MYKWKMTANRYYVLNVDWDVIVVWEVDMNIHRHLSGRDFNIADECININATDEVETGSDLEEARLSYKDKFGKMPHHKMKLETIIDKINAND